MEITDIDKAELLKRIAEEVDSHVGARHINTDLATNFADVIKESARDPGNRRSTCLPRDATFSDEIESELGRFTSVVVSRLLDQT